MIYWSKQYPENKQKEGLKRLQRACSNFFMYTDSQGNHIPEKSYRERLMSLHNIHKGRRCFILGNGPSLGNTNLSLLKDEITIGSNGIFLKFDEIGFSTTYFTMEDAEQVEDREQQLETVKGPTRIFALYNSYCIPERDDTIFANVERCSHGSGSQGKRFKDIYPQFSLDFASVVYLGATITYINIQLAYYLGCDPIYLIGLDHNYGEALNKYSPGKIDITDDVLKELDNAHFIPGYHSVGGRFGVPYVEQQEMAYAHAYYTLQAQGRNIFNASTATKLTIFPTVNYEDLF